MYCTNLHIVLRWVIQIEAQTSGHVTTDDCFTMEARRKIVWLSRYLYLWANFSLPKIYKILYVTPRGGGPQCITSPLVLWSAREVSLTWCMFLRTVISIVPYLAPLIFWGVGPRSQSKEEVLPEISHFHHFMRYFFS